MAKSVADQIVETLAAAGVKWVYGVAGDSLNGLTEALRHQKTIDWIHVRHEEVAAFAAGAEAQLTGTLAVCAGSCGPGNLHLINGLFDCHRSRAPVLAIAAHIPSAEIGSAYFQETHPEQLFRECSHFCELVSTSVQMPRMMEMAMQAAVGEQGVAVLVIPGNVALQPADAAATAGRAPIAPSPLEPPAADLHRLAALLNEAPAITLLCGAGCAGAHDEVVKLAEPLKAPIVHALRGKEHLEYDNPYDVGMTGLIGFSSGYHAMMECDVLLMLGTDFPYRQFYPDGETKIAQVDSRPAHIGRRARVDLGVVGDVRATVAALLPRLKPKAKTGWLEAAGEHYRKARRGLDELATGTPGRKPIHPQYVAKLISELASEEAVFSCDVGTTTIWAARYLRMNGRRRLLGSFVHGSMANALPQSIGAQAADPGRQVILMSGDGGLTMLMGDLITLTQMRLPVKVVVFNNRTLGFVELEQKAAGFLDVGVELHNPNFGAMATAMGIMGVRVEDPVEVESALRRAFDHDGPALVDIVTNRAELAMPPKIEPHQVLGFSLWTIKAVLNGRADEIVQLAKTNLLR